MSGKFIRRTLRNILLRNRPYFAQLALTHRCDSKGELDTEGMKRVVDVLDRLGVAMIGISGGGEPLLRDDFEEIVNYAGSKGLYIKLASNGAVPLDRYRRLLSSRVNEISLSVDGVEGGDLPFSHVSHKVLQTIHYLHGNLPEGKHLTLNVNVTASRGGAAATIADYCAREFPRARVWLNPVVSGEDKLRTVTDGALSPGHRETCSSPTLLSATSIPRLSGSSTLMRGSIGAAWRAAYSITGRCAMPEPTRWVTSMEHLEGGRKRNVAVVSACLPSC